MTSLHLERNLLKEHFRERTARANTKNMIDEKGSRQRDSKDSLSGTQGSAEAKTLTGVIALIHTSIRFFLPLSLTVCQRKPKERAKLNVHQIEEALGRKREKNTMPKTAHHHWALHNPLTSFQGSSSNRHLQKSKEKEKIMWQMPYLANSSLTSKQLVHKEQNSGLKTYSANVSGRSKGGTERGTGIGTALSS